MQQEKKRRAKEKAVDKAIKKTVVPVAKAKAAAQMLFKMNEGRIKRYCECRVLPAIAFTMHRRFGWGAKKDWQNGSENRVVHQRVHRGWDKSQACIYNNSLAMGRAE